MGKSVTSFRISRFPLAALGQAFIHSFIQQKRQSFRGGEHSFHRTILFPQFVNGLKDFQSNARLPAVKIPTKNPVKPPFKVWVSMSYLRGSSRKYPTTAQIAPPNPKTIPPRMAHLDIARDLSMSVECYLGLKLMKEIACSPAPFYPE